MKRKNIIIWFVLLALALLALALTFVPRPEPSATPTPMPLPTPTPTSAGPVLAEPTAPAEPTTEPTAEPTRACTEPEPVLVATRDIHGTPIPPPVGAGGVIKIEAAPCTRELALRDFAEIFRFWSNIDGDPFRRKPGYEERWNYFVQGQPAGEMWSFNNRWYAENKSCWAIWDTRGYEPERVEAIYQDPAGTTVWIFYRRDVTVVEIRKVADNSLAEVVQTDQGMMRWMLWWRDGRYKAVSYEGRVNLP